MYNNRSLVSVYKISAIIIAISLLLTTIYLYFQNTDETSIVSDRMIQNDAKYYAEVNFTDSRRPTMLKPFGGRETQHVCLGGEDELREYGPFTRHCVFKNMCYRISSKQWLYYSGEQNIPRVVGVHRGSQFCKENCEREDPFIYTDFETAKSPFVGVQYEAEHVTPILMQDLIPENAFFDKGKTEFTIHMYSLFNSDAVLGHMLSEYIYPMFHGLDIVGVRDRDVKLLLASSSCPNGQKCSIFYEAIKSFSKYYPQVGDINVNFPPNAPPPEYHPDLICYKLLYMGTGQLHGSSRKHYPDSWGRYVEKILYGMGLDPFHRPEKQRILFINKATNRVVLNGKVTAKKIGQVFNVDVDYYEYNGADFRQEVELVQKYTVCISVCGSTSFSCSFLPDGAANIFMSSWYSEDEFGRPGVNSNMDHVIWTYDRRHKYYAYPVWLNETTPDLSSAGYNEQYKYLHRWKHNKGFIVDFARMAMLVNDALRYAEANFGYSNSFKRLRKVDRHFNNYTILE